VEAALREAGISASTQEINALRDRVKSLRARRISPPLLRRQAQEHYRDYRRLGIGSEELARIARKMIHKKLKDFS